MTDVSPPQSRFAWPIALAGLALVVFAVVALSGPGRIDIIDGQTRFEVGRSLVEHGDSVLRDDRIWWGSYPGRGGQLYSYYRFPQSLLAAAAIFAADATGRESEGRRHFFYVLGGAVACGLASVLYALWFRHRGCGATSSILWGAGGVFCTPLWFYGTSTFDEYLGTTVLIAALVAAALGRSQGGALLAGLLLGLAYNCKQPLGSFVVLAVALQDDRAASRSQRLVRAALLAMGLLAGIVAEIGYDRIKFPFDKGTEHAEFRDLYGPDFADRPLTAIAVLTVSFGAGMIWYFPPLFLCLRGVAARWREERRVALALIVSALPFLAFIYSLSYFKGDPCWGPRYLTPLFGVLWLFARDGAARLRPSLVAVLLTLGVVVQLLALSVDPHRLYVQLDASSGFERSRPSLYYEPSLSHLINRPREILEIARDSQPAEEYSPASSPTFTFPLLDAPDRWYVDYKDEEGRPQRAHWTADLIRHAAKAGVLGDVHQVTVSRSESGPFLLLASIPEFRDLDHELPEGVERAHFMQRLEKRGPDVVRKYRVLNSLRPWWASMTFLPTADRPVNLGKFAAGLLATLSAGLLLLGVAVRRFENED